MKKILSLLLVATSLFACAKNSDYTITISNPSNFDRLADVAEISLDSVKAKVTLTDSLVYIVKTSDGKIIPSQITYDGKLIFQPELKANETKSFVITSGKAQSYPAKTYGRQVPERYDDFAWENDRVAFRAYGPSLIPIDGPSNGFDAWYKKTNNLIIDKWYKDDIAGKQSYHSDHGEGLDDYTVGGQALGAGAMAPYVDGKLVFNQNYESQEVLENGPLRTTFKLTYKNLDVNGTSVAESRTISLDAGSQLSKVQQYYTISEPLTVAAGLAKREKGDTVITAIDKGFVIYQEPKTPRSEGVYLTVVFPEGIKESIVDSYEYTHPKNNRLQKRSHVLAITTQQPNIPVTYYTGYGWKEFGFPTISDFEKYVENFAIALKEPLKITY